MNPPLLNPAAALRGALLCCITGLLPLTPDAASLDLDPERVLWSGVQISGSRLFLSVDAELGLTAYCASEAAGRLREPAQGAPIAPGGAVIETRYRTRAAGQRSEIVLLSDAASGAALQRHQYDFAGRLRQRTYRFTDSGAFLWTRRPGRGEERLPPERWSDAEQEFRPWPAAVDGQLIADPTGIFYLVAASTLSAPGDRAEFLVYSRRNLHRISVLLTGTQRISSDFELRRNGQSLRQQGSRDALRLLIHGVTMDEDETDDEFELLGLRGDIELFLDPETRAPLQLAGNVRILGRVTLRTTQVEGR